MKLQILQENLEKAVNIVGRFSSTKAQLPILGNILLSARKNKLFVSSTNLEISASVQIGAKIEEDGEITIPSKVIIDLVSNLPKDTIEMKSEKEQLKIISSEFSSNILGIDSTDFPKVPSYIDENKSVSIQKNYFAEALSKTIFATSLDETRPILTGVLFILSDKKLTLVATDGFRLSKKNISLSDHKNTTNTLVIPKNILGEMNRGIFEAEDLFMEVNEKEKQVLFGLGETVLTSRLLEGEYPEFEKIIPKKSDINIKLDKEELLRAVKLAAIFARESANVVKLKIMKDSIKISAESGQAGSQETKVDAKVEGGGPEVGTGKFEIAFNYRYLEDFIQSVKGEEISIGFNTPSSAGVFKDTLDPDYLHLIMPVKI